MNVFLYFDVEGCKQYIKIPTKSTNGEAYCTKFKKNPNMIASGAIYTSNT